MSRLVGKGPARFTDSAGSFEETHRNAVKAKGLFQAAGVRVPVSGRLDTYIKQLALARQVTRSTTRVPKGLDTELLQTAIATTSELSLIAEQLTAAPTLNGWQNKAHLAMKGKARPGEETSNPRAWDYQFELFVAALLRRAGYDIQIDEPDVVIDADGQYVGIAAKRSHSWKNFDELIADADDQIRRSGRIGIVALDISYLTNPTDGRVIGVGARAGLRDVKTMVAVFLEQQHARMLRLVDHDRTIGVIVYAAQLAVDVVTPRLSIARGSVFGNFCSLQSPNLRLFTAIRQRLTCAL